MPYAAVTTAPAASLAANYERDGYVFPIDVTSTAEAEAIREDLESAEAALAQDRENLSLLRSYPDRLLPSFDALIRNPNIIGTVSQILGPDLMVWNAGLFIKEANSPHVVTWHQDLTYWELDDAEEVTCWVALSPATLESGCMRFVAGSHKTQLVPHRDTYDENNLLSRGQEISVEVDDTEGIDIVLQTGQASMHHGHLFHSSGPNTTGDRRIGVAIRYIKPSMRQNGGDKSLVALVSGDDAYGHFKHAASPTERMSEAAFDLCREDAEIKRHLLYAGAVRDRGQRF